MTPQKTLIQRLRSGDLLELSESEVKTRLAALNSIKADLEYHGVAVPPELEENRQILIDYLPEAKLKDLVLGRDHGTSNTK